MKKVVFVALAAFLVVGLTSTAHAAKQWDDMSWWGNTGATPEPQPDTHCGCGEPRSGYWWWPTEPASNTGDTELWGNRGIVFHAWEKPAPPAPVEPPAPVTPEPVVRQVPVLNSVLFDFDKAVLKPEGKAVVDQLVAELKQYPSDTVVIEGHTCDIGTDAYNMGLGQRRANAVQDYMLQMGIDAGRVSTVSYGESQPAVGNTSPENRKLNRRAVFQYTVNQ